MRKPSRPALPRLVLSVAAAVLVLVASVAVTPTASAVEMGDTPAYPVEFSGLLRVSREPRDQHPQALPPASDPATVAVANSCNAGKPLYYPLWVKWTVTEANTYLLEGRAEARVGGYKLPFATMTAVLTDKLDVIDCSTSDVVADAGPTKLTAGQVVYVLSARTAPFDCSLADCQLTFNQGVFASPASQGTPGNDDWQNATQITSLPFTRVVDTTSATEQPVDDTLNAGPCATPYFARPRRTVWFRFTAGDEDTVTLGDPATRGRDIFDKNLAIAEETLGGPVWIPSTPCSGGKVPVQPGHTYLLQASTPLAYTDLPDQVLLGKSIPVKITSGGQVGLSDLTVSDVQVTPKNPTAGTPVRFRATVSNKGYAPTPGGMVLGVLFKVDGVPRAWSSTFNGVVGNGGGDETLGRDIILTSNSGPAGYATWPATAGPHTVEAIVDDVNRIKELVETNNSSTASINVASAPAKPDLIVTNISATPAAPAPGQAVRFSATVKNVGTAPKLVGPANRVLFKVDGTDRAFSSDSTVVIPAGGTVTVTSNAGPGGGNGTWSATPGVHTVQAIADDTSLVAESDESNNTYSVQLNVGAVPSLPDLIVTNVSYTAVDLLPFSPIRFTATVTNRGTRSTPAGTVVRVAFKPEGSTSGPTWSDTWTKPVRPGQTIRLTANAGSAQGLWRSGDPARAVKVTTTVDDLGKIAESHEFNNDLAVTVTIRSAG